MKKLLLIFFLFVFLFLAKTVHASEGDPSFVTIVNPVRIAPYTKNSAESIRSEYSEVEQKSLPATWLLTFDVVSNSGDVKVLKSFNNKQELGIFMEVSENFAKTAGVKYNKTDGWYRPTSLFLNGYSEEDRKKLIDTVFNSFKKKFGYYPKSVGAWWIDSYSLSYISKKYGVVANLGLSDQLSTDGYNVWGTYWSTPFYPRLGNAGMPASANNKIGPVTLEWAPRDPLNGYISPTNSRASQYSTQDYFTIGLSDDYFAKLLRLYTDPPFGQITIGLEGDFPGGTYKAKFADQLSLAQSIVSENGGKFSTMSEFAKVYQERNKKGTPDSFIESDDFLGSGQKVFWYQSSAYRIGLKFNPLNKETEIFDLRTYYENFQEPFYWNPNKQYFLFENLPFNIDKREWGKSIKFNTGDFVAAEKGNGVAIAFSKGIISLGKDNIEFINIPIKLDSSLGNTGSLKIKGDKSIQKITIGSEFGTSVEGLSFIDLTPRIPYAVSSRLSASRTSSLFFYFAIEGIVASSLFLYLVLRKRKRNISKYSLYIIGFLLLSFLVYRFSDRLYVSQSEIDSLNYLSTLPKGKILLFDKDCLKCKFNTSNKPAASEGRKNYVGNLTKMPIVYSLKIASAKDLETAKSVIDNIKPKYIYLAKYEDYVEIIPFDEKKLGIKKIFENANSTIYETNF